MPAGRSPEDFAVSTHLTLEITRRGVSILVTRGQCSKVAFTKIVLGVHHFTPIPVRKWHQFFTAKGGSLPLQIAGLNNFKVSYGEVVIDAEVGVDDDPAQEGNFVHLEFVLHLV
jgi:hypothetical protein